MSVAERQSVNPLRPLPDLTLPLNPGRIKVVEWARKMLEEGCVCLDTETTGFRNPEACEVGLVYLKGDSTTTLLSERVRPVSEIWEPGAIGVHGITPADVRGCRSFPEVYLDLLRETGKSDHVVIFNRSFDIRVVKVSLAAHGERVEFPPAGRGGCLVWPSGALVRCAMLAMSYWNQEPGNGKNWKWPRLPDYGHQAHSALGDCMSTANLIQDLASINI